MTTLRPIARSTVALSLALLLSSCSPAQPAPTVPSETTAAQTPESPTPSPEPMSSAPKSEEEAKSSAESTISKYLTLRGEVNAAGGTDTAPLRSVADGQALIVAEEDAARVATDKKTTSGQLTFEPISSIVSDITANGVSLPFHTVTVTGCQDGSNYNITLADGSEAMRPSSRRSLIAMTVLFDPNFNSWLVNYVEAKEGSC